MYYVTYIMLTLFYAIYEYVYLCGIFISGANDAFSLFDALHIFKADLLLFTIFERTHKSFSN